MEKIKTILKDHNASVVDVRAPWEFEEGHIKGAINIPLNEIPARMSDFKKMNGPVILYCRSGNRSGMAANILKQAGISNIYNGGSLFDMQQLSMN